MSCILSCVFADGCIEFKNIHGMYNIKSVAHMMMDIIMQQRMMSVKLMDISSWLWYTNFEVSDSDTMQYEARSRVPHCLSDPVWTNSPHGAPPL